MNLSCKKIPSGIKMALILYVFLFIGCIPELTDETPLAMVNNEPVTYGEFKRELQGVHLIQREREKIGPVELNKFLDKLIRKRLFIQEAIRVGLHQDPDIDRAVDSELKRQAMILLHREEIDDKVAVSDDEAWERYSAILNKRRDNVEKIREGFSINPNGRSEDVRDYISGLRKKAKIEVDQNFVWHRDESCDPNKVVARVNGKEITYYELSAAINARRRNEFGKEKAWEPALQDLVDQWLLDQEAKRFVPTKDSFEMSKKRLKKDLQKERREQREDAYLEELRQRAKILKMAIDPNDLLRVAEDPNHTVARVNDESITLAELKSEIKTKDLRDHTPEKIKSMMEASLQYLIDYRLIEQEALSRGYQNQPDVKRALTALKESIIYKNFFQKLLFPSIKIKDEEVESYYKEHLDLFRTPIYVKLDEIRVKTKEESDQIWSELEAGANFAFLSKRSLPNRIANQHWIPIEKLSPSIREGLVHVGQGDRFGPVLWENGYSIFLLKRRQGGEQIPFDRARKDAKEKLWKERYEKAIERWDKLLRASSEIVIYEDRLQAILSGVRGGKG